METQIPAAGQSRSKRERGLTQLQLRFVEEYVKDCNGTRAAERAGFRARTDAARASSASTTLKNPKVAKAIAERFAAMAMSAEEAIKRLTDIARGSMVPFIRIDDDGSVWFNLADPEARKHMHLIKSIKTQRYVDKTDRKNWEHEWVEVTLHDAHGALRDILKLHGKLEDRLKLSGKVEHEVRQVIKIGDQEIEF